MITDEELLERGLGILNGLSNSFTRKIQPVAGAKVHMKKLKQGHRMLLLAGYSVMTHIPDSTNARPQDRRFIVWIISDDPRNDPWDRTGYPEFFAGSGNCAPLYVAKDYVTED